MELISVIVLDCGEFKEIFTFPSNPIGIKKAEKKFKEQVMSLFSPTENLSQEDLDSFLDDGYYEDCVYITHHNCDERG